MNILAADTHPLLTPRVARRIRQQFLDSKADEDFRQAIHDWDVHWIERGFVAYETIIATMAGEYCIGNSITLADVCLVAAVWTAQRFSVEVEQFPTIWRVFQKLSELEAVKKAHWNCQPDTPESLRVK
jgi:maleylacetoacetate isomerase